MLTAINFFNLAMDKCGPGQNKCDKNAQCSQNKTKIICTCNEGFKGNGLTCRSKSLARFFYSCNIYCSFKICLKTFISESFKA